MTSKPGSITQALAPYLSSGMTNRNDAIPGPFDLLNFSGKMAPAFAAALDPTESLAEGIKRPELPLDWEPLVKLGGCPFIREALRTGGKEYTQPMWNLTTLAATFLKNGHALAHKMGNKYPTYTHEETEALWERKQRERREKGLGWPSCNAIQAAGCAACASCPHFGKIKSPLNLTAPVAPSATEDRNSTQSVTIDTKPAAWNAGDLKVSFSNIPHRRWLYATYLIRGEITVLAAPGGAGKTALAIGIAVEIATGKENLGEKVWRTEDQRALYVNGEDGSIEIRRRLWAFCQQHKVAEQGLTQLYVAGADDTRVQSLSFLCMNDKGATALNEAAFNVLESALHLLHPDLLVLDPLVVFCGGGNMNDNSVMSLVMRKLKALAVKYDCAILVVHHTRKGSRTGSDATGEAEAISGAAAIVNLARRAIMPVTMTDNEVKQFTTVLPSQRLQYFKLVDAKSNLAPLTTDAPWYELVSEELPNAEPPIYPNGDRVQAVKRAYLSRSKDSSFAGPEQLKIRFEILKLIDRGLTINGEKVPYSPNSTGNNKKRAILDDAMAAVEQATEGREWLPRDLRATAERELEALKHDGWVVVEKIAKGRFRRSYGLRPVWERTPWAKEREDLHQHGGPTVRTPEEEQDLERSDLKNSLEELVRPNGQSVNDAVND
jgi:AAA domain